MRDLLLQRLELANSPDQPSTAAPHAPQRLRQPVVEFSGAAEILTARERAERDFEQLEVRSSNDAIVRGAVAAGTVGVIRHGDHRG